MTPHFIDCEQNIPAIDIKKLENHIEKKCLFNRNRLIKLENKEIYLCHNTHSRFGNCNDLKKLFCQKNIT